MVVTLILALLSTFFTVSSPAWAVNVNCPADSLQSAIDSANPGDTIVVSGTCTGNFLVRNDKVRLFIQSTGLASGVCVGRTATIFGGLSGTALDIRGKAVSVSCMVITGGDNGIVVQRGANAVLDQNQVQNANGEGITVSSSAFAAITNNDIRGNEGAGIKVMENSSARIGWNSSQSGPAAPNDIFINDIGILVTGSSSARITSNTIHDNSSDGIRVAGGAQVDASKNAIDGNSGDGIFITENSALSSGGDTGIFALPNSTTTNNIGFGIRCTAGGSLNGITGTLNGVMGQTSVAGNCPNNLVP